MRIHLISVEAVESTPTASSRAAGLARGAEALVEGGLIEALRSAGTESVARVKPRLHGHQISGDPIDNLGRLNGQIGAEVGAAIAAGGFPVLAGGTCNHLVGILAGLQGAHGPAARIGLIWLASATRAGASWPGWPRRFPRTAS
jgi:arginase family enzyme